MISVLILTKNEEKDLPGCLQSLSWCDDIHILDSFSDDETVDIATKYGVNITQRKFDGYASQRNYALNNFSYKHPWIFILDADERIPDALLRESFNRLETVEDSINGFRIKRKDFLNTTWLKHAQLCPFYIRLIRNGKAQYHREINEVIVVSGKIIDLDEHFNHYPFSKGYAHWLNKHNRYSTMEAQRWIDEHNGNFDFSWRKAVFGKDFSEKRYHQKGLFYKLPGRPVIKWFYMMIVNRAFLDGKAGLIYATLQSIYEYFIVLKTRELLNSPKTSTVGKVKEKPVLQLLESF